MNYVVKDTSLTAVADAIRTKSGGNGQLEFPSGFVSEIEGIEKGFSPEDIFSRKISGVINITSKSNNSINGMFQNCTLITGINAPETTDFYTNCFKNCTGLTVVNLPKATGSQCLFQGCTNLQTIVMPNAYDIWSSFASGCSKLEVFDNGRKTEATNGMRSTSAFSNCTSLKTIILRFITINPLSNINNFNNTPFASGKSGGTIYIPKVLYDHLGDGTSLDYQSATNWSTINGYGTITWAKIEDSIYETHYADGTLIPTS